MSHFDRFEQTKQEMLNQLLLAKTYTEKQGFQSIAEEFSTVHHTLQREQFEVMVVGEFSNGKSTFINALMRNIVLPSSNVPTTAFINKITYADTPKFEVYFDNGKKETLDQEEFLAYVSEDKRKFDQVKDAIINKLNPMAKHATHLQIGYPTEICKNNIIIIDSPGTNDMDERRVQITDEYIPKSDAAIFVLNAKKIFSASERAFLQRIMDADIQKIFFVINFKDAINNEEEMREIEQVVMSNLPQGLQKPKVHFVSALHALQHYVPPAPSSNPRAKRRESQRLPLEQTGLLELEQALFTFLTEDSGRAKLEKPYQRAQRLLRRVIDEHLTFEMQTLSKSIDNIDQFVTESNAKLLSAEKNIKADTQDFYRQLERESQEIMIWYKKKTAEISATAKDYLQDGIDSGTNPESIKTDIDLATGPLEKALKQQLKKKTDALMTNLFSKRTAQMSHDISGLTNRILSQAENKSDWGHTITASTKNEDTVADMAIGGAVLGGLLLVASGGILGWGALGAGVGAGAVYLVNENSKDAIQELKSQVSNRYEKGLAKQVKALEKDFERLTAELRDSYENYSYVLIEAERKRTQQLVTNQKLSANDQQQKIAALKQQKQIAESLLFQFDKTFNTYCQKAETTIYV